MLTAVDRTQNVRICATTAVMYPAATGRARPLIIAFGDLPTWVGAIGTVLGCQGLGFVASAYRWTSFSPGRIRLDKRWGDWLAMRRVEMPVSLVETEDGFILTAYPGRRQSRWILNRAVDRLLEVTTE